MNSFAFLVLLSFAAAVYGQRRDDDYIEYSNEGVEDVYVPPRPHKHSIRAHKFIRKFLRAYCRDAPGDYKRCRQCVAVGCLSYMKSPRSVDQYETCINDNNRCCTRRGPSLGNVFLAGKCYVTGAFSEVLGGQLSAARAAVGGQASDAPKAFQDTSSRQ